MKRIVKITITLLISVSLLAILFIGFLFYIKKNQTRLLLNQIHKNIGTEILAENINVSIFKHFPSVDVTFYNIKLLSSKDFKPLNTDTLNSKLLLFAKEVDVSFDILKLLNGQYIIKGISIKDGSLFLYNNNLNQNNYQSFLTKKSNDDSLEIKIKYIALKNFNIIYYDESKELYLRPNIVKVKLSGDIVNKNINGNFSTKTLNIHTKSFKKMITESIEVEFNLKNKNKVYEIKSLEIIHNKNKVNISGTYSENQKIANLNFYSKSFNLQVINDYFNLPKNLKSIKGYLNITGNLVTKIDNLEQTSFNSSITLNSSVISYKNQIYKNGQGNIKVHYSKYFSIDAKTITFNTENSFINLSNANYFGKNDSLSGNLEIKISSSELNNFIKNKNCKFEKGNIELKSELNSSLKSKTINNLVRAFTKNCNFSLINLEGNIYGNKINNLNSICNIKNGNINILDLKGNINNSNAHFNGSINHLIECYLDSTSNFNINGNLKSDFINIDSLMIGFSSPGANSKQLEPKIKMHLEINNLVYGYSSFNNFKSDLNYYNNKLFFSNITSNTLSGKLINSNLQLEFNKDSLSVSSDNTFHQIDIKQLLTSLDNFGQNQFVAENISGKINGNCQLKMLWIKNKISKKDIQLVSNLEISNGVLENYKPLYKLSGFIDLKELYSIKFETIKNKIFIKDNIIKIPQVDIKSSALNLTLAGQHSFDNKFEYHIKIHLSELLSKKFNKQKKEKSEFGQIEVDTLHRISLYFKYFGDSVNSKFEYDTKKGYNAFSNITKKSDSNIIKSIRNELDNELEQNNNINKEKNSVIESELLNKTEKKKTKKSGHAIEWKDE
jgi:hypothetical protein